jgi:hypothetical protein
MENDNVVYGLICRWEEIGDELEIVQGRMRHLVINLDALDVFIRLFRTNIEIGAIPVKPVQKDHDGCEVGL